MVDDGAERRPVAVNEGVDQQHVGGALHGGADNGIDSPGDGEPSEFHREDELEEQTEPEDGHRVNDDAVHPQGVVGGPTAMGGGVGPEEETDGKGEEGPGHY